MSKNIAISDEVYRKLKCEKGDRSFSEVIEDHLTNEARLTDVTGQQIFDPDTIHRVKADIRELSRGTLTNLDDAS